MIELGFSVSLISAVRDIPNDDTLPGPYDSLEHDTVFATLFDLRPATGAFFGDLIF